MKMEKKYYWLIAVNVIIIFLVLLYSWAGHVERIMPDRCIFRDVECQKFSINGITDEIFLKLNNGLGSIEVVNMNVSREVDNINVSRRVTVGPFTYQILCNDLSFPFTWPKGQAKEFSFKGCGEDKADFVVGDKEKISIEIEYYETKPIYSHILLGEIFARVKGKESDEFVSNFKKILYESKLLINALLLVFLLDCLIVALLDKKLNKGISLVDTKETFFMAFKLVGMSLILAIAVYYIIGLLSS